MLFEVLARSDRFWSLGDESHEVLEGPFHPRLRGWESNALAAADLDAATAAALVGEFERRAQPGRLRRAKQDRRRQGHGGALARLGYALVRLQSGAAQLRAGHAIRLLEKTPKNCLRIPFLQALFPDARFVFLRRDGRPTVSSLIDAWRAGGRYVTYHLPTPVHIAGRVGDEWCFLLPRGWRALAGAPLEEVCATQWLAAVRPCRRPSPRSGRPGASTSSRTKTWSPIRRPSLRRSAPSSTSRGSRTSSCRAARSRRSTC
jgi:hypothetical protein